MEAIPLRTHSSRVEFSNNTGKFEVTAVLAEIHADKVRLLKANGKYTTVPMRRLSEEKSTDG